VTVAVASVHKLRYVPLSRGDVSQHGQQIRLAAHRRAEHLDLAKEDVAQIDVRVKPRRRAARDDPPAVLHRANALLEHVAADVLDHEVDAALLRQPARLRHEVPARVVDHLVRAELLRACELLVGPGGRDHARAVQLRDLDRRHSDSRSRALYEHGIARRDPSLVDDHLPRREKRQDRRRRLRPAQPLGIRRDVDLRHDDVLGIPALRVLAQDLVEPAQVIVATQARRAPHAR
jgi:hypothetical protein